MMAKSLELNGMIHTKFKSEAEMADALGWNRQRLNKITNRRKEPNLDEVYAMSRVLDRSFIEIAKIFLEK